MRHKHPHDTAWSRSLSVPLCLITNIHTTTTTTTQNDTNSSGRAASCASSRPATASATPTTKCALLCTSVCVGLCIPYLFGGPCNHHFHIHVCVLLPSMPCHMPCASPPPHLHTTQHTFPPPAPPQGLQGRVPGGHHGQVQGLPRLDAPAQHADARGPVLVLLRRLAQDGAAHLQEQGACVRASAS
jgi:hypothetical protein